MVATGCLLLMNFLLINQVMGQTINVTSVAAMESEANSANAGAIIVLADGTYLNNTFNISGSNITVRAENPGGVYLNGSNHITISGDYIIFSGFQFTGGDIGEDKMLEVYGDHNNVTHCNWNGYSAKRYIDIKGGSQYNEVSYCNFEDKPASAALSALVHIRPHATVPGYHVIRYCSFQNMPGEGGDYGNEPIKIGSGSYSTYASRSTVEFCYWNNTGLADSESISIKCRENTIRYNTFTNQQDAKLVFRNGDDNKAYGNFFIGAGGIRVKEASNIDCYNNYFENSGNASESAVKYVYLPGNLNDVTFTNNTFVECEGRIDIDECGENNTWNNNIFFKTSGDIFKDVDPSISWDGNIYQGTLGATFSSGMTNDDPELTLNGDGYYGLSSTSPCIDAGVSIPAIQNFANVDDDPSLLLDISGQTRSPSATSKDIGCDEYTTGDITNRPLTISDVGPSYLMTTTGLLTNLHNASSTITIYPNPASRDVTLKYSLPERARVFLAIYSLNGQMIKTLVDNEMQTPKNYTSNIDVSDLSEGVYIVHLRTGSVKKSLRLIIK